MTKLLDNKKFLKFLKSDDFKTIFFLNVLVLFLVCVWFGSRTMLATAEEGIPLYNSARTLEGVTHVWQNTGLGLASPFVTPLITLFGFTTILEGLGLAAWLTQSILFYLILICALISMYYLCEFLFNEKFNLILG